VPLPRSSSSCWSLERGIALNSPRVALTKILKLKPKTNFSNEARAQPKHKTAVPHVLRPLCPAFREVLSDSDVFRKPISQSVLSLWRFDGSGLLGFAFFDFFPPYLTISTILSTILLLRHSLIRLTLPDCYYSCTFFSRTLPKQTVVARNRLRGVRCSMLASAFPICSIWVY